MAKIIDITEKLNFEERPKLVIKGVEIELAKRALTLASHKLPVKTVIVVKEGAFA